MKRPSHAPIQGLGPGSPHPQTGPMRGPRATEGATLIVVVLFTMLLLAALLAATLRLGLGSRQNTADQAATLRAQYAAESGIALAQSRLRDIQTMLTRGKKDAAGEPVMDASGNEIRYLKLTTGTLSSKMEDYAKNFCGKSSTVNLWVPTNDFKIPRHANDETPYEDAEQCIAESNATVSALTFEVIADNMQNVAYEVFPPCERPGATCNQATITSNKSEWWKSILNFSRGGVGYTIKPVKVVKLTDYTYRFYIKLLTAKSAGDSSGATRYLSGNGTKEAIWWFELKLPNPFDFVVFDDTEETLGFKDNVFDGDYFTNERVRFVSGADVKFRGNAYSAGCKQGFYPTAGSGLDCSPKEAGFFVGNSNTVNDNLPQFANYSTFDTGKLAKFRAEYIEMPSNSSDQQTAANGKGLVLLSNETKVEIFAGDSSGNPLNSYNPSQRKWNEPDPVYQYIRLRNSSGNVIREFRYKKNMILERKTGANSWSDEPDKSPFNGVLYNSGELTVNGPDRLSYPNSSNINTNPPIDKMPPALSSFAQINITTTGKLNIASDLTMSDTPCDNQEKINGTSTVCVKDPLPRNSLLLYTTTGDLNIPTGTPNNITMYAAMMSSRGGLSVDEISDRPAQGKINVVGSLVEKKVRPKFLLKSNGDLKNGYFASYSYDNRFKAGILPEASPISKVWTVKDADDTDLNLTRLIWRQVGSGDF